MKKEPRGGACAHYVVVVFATDRDTDNRYSNMPNIPTSPSPLSPFPSPLAPLSLETVFGD